jgi:hypothetical protein
VQNEVLLQFRQILETEAVSQVWECAAQNQRKLAGVSCCTFILSYFLSTKKEEVHYQQVYRFHVWQSKMSVSGETEAKIDSFFAL